MQGLNHVGVVSSTGLLGSLLVVLVARNALLHYLLFSVSNSFTIMSM